MGYYIRPLVEATNTIYGEYDTPEQAAARMKTLSVLIKAQVVWACVNEITQKVESLAYQGEVFTFQRFVRSNVLQV